MRALPARALNPAELDENEAFLTELCRTGNAREAARRLGAHRAKFTKRRAKHRDAALALSQDILADAHAFDPALTRLANGRLQLRPERDFGINADRRLEFIAMLGTFGSARAAAETLGFSHAAFHHYKAHDPEFARSWHEALYGAAAWRRV